MHFEKEEEIAGCKKCLQLTRNKGDCSVQQTRLRKRNEVTTAAEGRPKIDGELTKPVEEEFKKSVKS